MSFARKMAFQCNFTLMLFLLGSIILVQAHNKYSKESNKNFSSLERPFRMQKLNLIWEKGFQDQKLLEKLYQDLKSQDKDELSLKKLKSENQDKEGLKEAQIRKQLNRILSKYGLEPADTLNVASKQNTDSDNKEHESSFFKDKKLDKLWKKAQKADFTESQLKILKEELRHYEEKLAQYHQLTSDLEHRNHDEYARNENHIDAFLEMEETKDSKVKEVNQKLKQKHIELKDEYRRLSDAVYNGSANGGNLKGEFEEDRVSKLWNLALKSDFTDEELDSLRDEMLHFQNRIKKLKFFEAQIESDRLAGREENQPLDDHVDQHKHIARKVKELNYKVDKMHSELEDRILRRHSEL